MPICYHSAYNNYIQNIKAYRAPNLNMITPSESHVCLSVSLLLLLFNFFFYFLLGNLVWMAVTQIRHTKLQKASGRSCLSSPYSTSVVPKLIRGNVHSPFNFHTIICIFCRKVKVMSTFKKLSTHKFPQSTASVIQKSVWYLPLALSFPSTTWLREVQGVIESEFLTFLHTCSFIHSVSHDLKSQALGWALLLE